MSPTLHTDVLCCALDAVQSQVVIELQSQVVEVGCKQYSLQRGGRLSSLAVRRLEGTQGCSVHRHEGAVY